MWRKLWEVYLDFVARHCTAAGIRRHVYLHKLGVQRSQTWFNNFDMFNKLLNCHMKFKGIEAIQNKYHGGNWSPVHEHHLISHLYMPLLMQIWLLHPVLLRCLMGHPLITGADLNRVIARDYQLFREDSIAKKGLLKGAHVQTFGQPILLSVSPKASIPNFQGEIKAPWDTLKALEGRYRSVVVRTKKRRKRWQPLEQMVRPTRRWLWCWRRRIWRLWRTDTTR